MASVPAVMSAGASILKAAVAAGFRSYDEFSNKFEEIRGMTPEAYRRDKKRQRRANGS